MTIVREHLRKTKKGYANVRSHPRTSSLFTQGIAYKKGITAKDVDQLQLKKGVKVEKEHTDSTRVARKIAVDHLAEIPDYYTRLKIMENKPEKQRGFRILTASKPEDIDNWPCACSVFTGKSCHGKYCAKCRK